MVIGHPIHGIDDVEDILAGNYWYSVKYQYDDDGNCIYKGCNHNYDAEEDDENWFITRYYYDDDGNCIAKKVRQNSWTNRANGW